MILWKVQYQQLDLWYNVRTMQRYNPAVVRKCQDIKYPVH